MTSDACKQLHFIVEEFVKISLFVELMSGWINELFTTWLANNGTCKTLNVSHFKKGMQVIETKIGWTVGTMKTGKRPIRNYHPSLHGLFSGRFPWLTLIWIHFDFRLSQATNAKKICQLLGGLKLTKFFKTNRLQISVEIVVTQKLADLWEIASLNVGEHVNPLICKHFLITHSKYRIHNSTF